MKNQSCWNQPLGLPECPYAFRYVFDFYLFSIRVHKWIRSDDKRYFHDHPWHFITFCLSGGYTDVSPNGRDNFEQWDIRYRKATHKHYVEVHEETWTVLLCGPPIRKWGFWVGARQFIMRPLRYFSRYGHPPCSEL
jgi:hypothetical protein